LPLNTIHESTIRCPRRPNSRSGDRPPAAGDAEVEPGPIKTYTIKHDRGDEVLPLLIAYRKALDSMLDDVWKTVTWRKVKIRGKKQFRLFPRYRKDDEFKKSLRNRYLEGWTFAAHRVDSALATAFSIMESWRKNYNRGDRKGKRPVARRLFARAPQDVCRLEGEELRSRSRPGGLCGSTCLGATSPCRGRCHRAGSASP